MIRDITHLVQGLLRMHKPWASSPPALQKKKRRRREMNRADIYAQFNKRLKAFSFISLMLSETVVN